MIYQICGFNYICDRFIEKLSGYIVDEADKQFPVVKVQFSNSLSFDIPDKIEMINHLGYSAHSNNQSFYRFSDGSSILFSPDEVVFCGECFDDDRIANELSRADIVVLARYHKRAVLHGSAFMYRGKAYLICAPSGAGKSTLSSALVNNYDDISFLSDDILCIREDGHALYKGLPSVSLNNDSLKGVFKTPSVTKIASTKSNIYKKTLFFSDANNHMDNQIVEIGGVFFLQEPSRDNLLYIEELNSLSFLCEAVKNIKHKPAMINQLLLQEMQILNNLAKSTFAVKLRIKHDYSVLHEITSNIIEYIDKRRLQQEGRVVNET